MWFTENPWPPMVITAIGALICLAIWNSERRNLHLYLALGFFALTGAIYGIERAVVTEGERVQDQVVQLCDQFRRHDPGTLNHFSDTAPELKVMCKTAMDMVEISDNLRLTDFSTTFTNNGSRANVHFRANAEITVASFKGHHSFRCILVFGKEGGVWKIVEVQRLDPIKGEKIGILDPR